MKWLDGSDINIKEMTGEDLCGRLADEMYEYDYPQWLKADDIIKNAVFIIAFDTELQMEGIFSFLENSLGHYYDEIIKAFSDIGDDDDARVLREICRLADPDSMRGETLQSGHEEYDISCFNEAHELREDIAEKIEELEKKLYLHTDSDMWQLLFGWLDRRIKEI